jgi:hypothetical protein
MLKLLPSKQCRRRTKPRLREAAENHKQRILGKVGFWNSWGRDQRSTKEGLVVAANKIGWNNNSWRQHKDGGGCMIVGGSWRLLFCRCGSCGSLGRFWSCSKAIEKIVVWTLEKHKRLITPPRLLIEEVTTDTHCWRNWSSKDTKNYEWVLPGIRSCCL